VANYLRFLTLGGPGDFPARSGGVRLGALLLAPFRETLGRGIKSLIVIPDGPLHYLPFETLIDAGRSSRFLVEDFDVRYGASASCLINLKDRPAPERYAMDFLGLANPFPTRAFGLSVDEDLSFPALPDSLKEIRDIRGHFDPAKTTVLLGHDAQDRAFKSLPLADYRIIHLAAHGFFDDRNWWRSSLILLPDPQRSEDGFLQPDDVYGLHLAPELLVLSACETGIGRLEKGEGVNGLSYAFFYAGARSILLSLWSVPDRTTSAFMVSFYDYWMAGRPKSEALRLAKIKALRSNGGNPFYWAAFVLLGN
jgi:CHAT domain-containing protein